MEGVYKISDELKQKSAEYRESLFRHNPAVKKFIKIRKGFVYVLMALLILHSVLMAFFMFKEQSLSNLPVEAMKFCLHLLLLAITLWGGWKASLGLYIAAIPSVVTAAITWGNLFIPINLIFTSLPLATLFLTDMVYTALLMGTVIWLTVFPKSRLLADEAKRIQLEYTRFVRDNVCKPQQ